MKKNKRVTQWLFVTLIMFVHAAVLFTGDTGKIAGQIVDAETNEPLPGANIEVEGTVLGAASDLSGEYFIINIPPGIYDLRVSYMGYQSEVRNLVRILVDKTTRLDFNLTPQVLEGQEVVVVAYKEDAIEMDLTATKQTYEVDEIQSLPGMTDIIDLQADVDGGHFRGGRTGEAIYLIGGAAIVNPLDNSRAFAPMTIGLEQVEVYTSGFSAEYGNVQSGVINIVTKEGRSDKWETHIDASTTNSYYKT